MEKELICIQCPKGCTVKIKYEDKNIQSIVGFACSKGKEYAISEFTESKRVLTSTVRVKTDHNERILPVKTDGEIPLDLIHKAIKMIRQKVYTAPVKEGDVLYENILDTNVNLVATGRINNP